MFDTIRGDFAPYRAVGSAALPGYMALLGLDPSVLSAPSGGSTSAGTSTGGRTVGSTSVQMPVAPMKAGDINWSQLLQDRPDVLAEYNKVMQTADRNSPWFTQHGLDRGPEGFAEWWYNNNRPAEDTYAAPTWTQEQIDKLYPQTPAVSGGTGGSVTTGGATTPNHSGFNYQGIQDYLENLPGYKFVRDQGIRNVTNQLTTKGLGGISGAMAKGISRFVTGLADQTYGEQLTRIQQAVAGGSSAAAQTGGFGTTAATGAANSITSGANAVSNAITGAANASAAGTVGSANAIGAGLNGASNALLTSAILRNPTSGGGGGLYSGQTSI